MGEQQAAGLVDAAEPLLFGGRAGGAMGDRL